MIGLKILANFYKILVCKGFTVSTRYLESVSAGLDLTCLHNARACLEVF